MSSKRRKVGGRGPGRKNSNANIDNSQDYLAIGSPHSNSSTQIDVSLNNLLQNYNDASLQLQNAIDAAPPSASPSKLQSRASIVQGIRQTHSRLESHISNFATLHSTEPATEEVTLERPKTKLTPVLSPLDRVREILAPIGFDPVPTVTSQEAVAAILLDKHPRADLRETAALVKLATGYEYAFVESWMLYLPVHSSPVDLIPDKLIDILQKAERDERTEDRLLRQDQVLIGSKPGIKLYAYVHYVIYVVESIKFALDFNALDNTAKSAYVEHAAKHCCALKLALAKTEEDARAIIVSWKNKHRRMVTMRNHLVTLYSMFGSALLLDPSWGAGAESAGLAQTIQLLQGEITKNDTPYDYADFWEANDKTARRSLKNLFTAMTQNSLWYYTKGFLESYPYRTCTL